MRTEANSQGLRSAQLLRCATILHMEASSQGLGNIHGCMDTQWTETNWHWWVERLPRSSVWPQGTISWCTSADSTKRPGKNWDPMHVVLSMGGEGEVPKRFNGVSGACLPVCGF